MYIETENKSTGELKKLSRELDHAVYVAECYSASDVTTLLAVDQEIARRREEGRADFDVRVSVLVPAYASVRVVARSEEEAVELIQKRIESDPGRAVEEMVWKNDYEIHGTEFSDMTALYAVEDYNAEEDAE